MGLFQLFVVVVDAAVVVVVFRGNCFALDDDGVDDVVVGVFRENYFVLEVVGEVVYVPGFELVEQVLEGPGLYLD